MARGFLLPVHGQPKSRRVLWVYAHWRHKGLLDLDQGRTSTFSIASFSLSLMSEAEDICRVFL